MSRARKLAGGTKARLIQRFPRLLKRLVDPPALANFLNHVWTVYFCNSDDFAATLFGHTMSFAGHVLPVRIAAKFKCFCEAVARPGVGDRNCFHCSARQRCLADRTRILGSQGAWGLMAHLQDPRQRARIGPWG